MITLASHASFEGLGQSYDVAMDKAGTAYVGWIAADATTPSDRQLHLCVLPVGAKACKGGVQTADLTDASTAAGVKVLATPNGVTLVWFHDTDASSTGPRGGAIAASVVQPDDTLATPVDLASAPSHGELLDAAVGPGGAIWTVAYAGLPEKSVEVRPGVTNSPVTAKTSFPVGQGLLAFDGQRPVLVTDEAGRITEAAESSYFSAGEWSAPTPIKKTWASNILTLAGTKSGVRVITTINNASYAPVVAKWAGNKFGMRTKIGHGPATCFPTTHDATTDASGRLVDVATDCSNGKLAVSNMADTVHSGVLRFAATGTPAAEAPQIATSPRGHAWIAYSYQSAASDPGDRLLAIPFLLQGVDRSTSKNGPHGSVSITGPTSCQPASAIHIGVTGHPDSGWKVGSTTLRLDGKKLGGTLDGASLKPGKKYTLKGSVTFTGSGHSTVTASLTFKACPTP